MTINLQWMTEGESVSETCLVFSFESAEKLSQGVLSVSYVAADTALKQVNNLAVCGVGRNELLKSVASLGYRKITKGNLEDNTARDVYPIINDPGLLFRAGLTVHASRGSWSSLPHKFEAEEILTPRPMPFYEQFAYVTDPPGGWGAQVRIGHVYHEFPDSRFDGLQFTNRIEVIRDRDILEIPLGSHPVTGGPGVRLMYFWIYSTSGPTAAVTMSQREKF